jgi:hypothetical protein
MNKVKLALGSRTFWTIVVLFLVNGVSAIHSSIPAQYLPIVDGVISILAVYFHVTPSQNYGFPKSTSAVTGTQPVEVSDTTQA